MNDNKSRLMTRRQALLSIAALSAGTLIKPSSVFCSPVKDKLRFAVIGDWGTGDTDAINTAKQLITAHQSSALDFVISAGDNVYPNGSGRYFAKCFEQPFSELVKQKIKFYAVLGNHDVREGRQDQCQYPLFNMGGMNFYKLEKGAGLADFFMIDSTDYDATQANWLETSLRNSKARWKIATLHHPIYSSGKRHGSDTGLRKKLEPLFTRYGVSVVLSGHDHIYERTKTQQGIQYFVTGAGGKCRRGDVDLKSPFREVSYDEDNHFMVMEIDDKQISFKAISEPGQLIDSGIIQQG
ncbi:MAG: metallophosphoesterase [Acidobacteriota bacterium]